MLLTYAVAHPDAMLHQEAGTTSMTCIHKTRTTHTHSPESPPTPTLTPSISPLKHPISPLSHDPSSGRISCIWNNDVTGVAWGARMCCQSGGGGSNDNAHGVQGIFFIKSTLITCPPFLSTPAPPPVDPHGHLKGRMRERADV